MKVRVILYAGLLLAVGCKTTTAGPQQADGSKARATSSGASTPAPAAAKEQAAAQQKAIAAEGGLHEKVASDAPHLPLSNARPADPKASDFIGSCRVEVGAAEYCLQSDGQASLFFCGGQVSKAGCDKSRYRHVCKHAVKQGAGGVTQSLILYTTAVDALPTSCDGGTLQEL